jgi:hypothetical protein
MPEQEKFEGQTVLEETINELSSAMEVISPHPLLQLEHGFISFPALTEADTRSRIEINFLSQFGQVILLASRESQRDLYIFESFQIESEDKPVANEQILQMINEFILYYLQEITPRLQEISNETMTSLCNRIYFKTSLILRQNVDSNIRLPSGDITFFAASEEDQLNGFHVYKPRVITVRTNDQENRSELQIKRETPTQAFTITSIQLQVEDEGAYLFTGNHLSDIYLSLAVRCITQLEQLLHELDNYKIPGKEPI